MACLRSLWYGLREWLPYILPAISNFVMVMAGIVLSFPKIVEPIESKPRLRRVVGVILVVFGVSGFAFEVRERHNNALSARELTSNTTKLVQETTTLVTTATITLPMINDLKTKLTYLDGEIEKAKEKHDPKLLAQLQTQVAETKQQAENLSHELLAITLAPQVADQLRGWEGEMRYRDQELHNFEYEAELHYKQAHPDDGAGLNKIQEEWEAKYQQSQNDYIAKLRSLIANADTVRLEMLQRIPVSAQNELDKTEAQAFEAAKMKPFSLNRPPAANYLESLAKRVPPPK